MTKNIEDMIVPDKRRSIRDIPIPEGRRKSDPRNSKTSTGTSKRVSTDGIKKAPAMREVEVEESSLPPQRPIIPRRRRTSRKRLWGVGILSLALLLFIILSIFSGATLSYTPKSAAMVFDGDTYTAQKSGETGLFYSVVKLSREKGMEAPAGAEQEVSRRASGVIIIYNDNTDSQRLVENTRFESPAGKVYRISSAVTVPGRKTVSGVSQPGTLEATVYADGPGDTYNSAPTDFTLPGLSGTARFKTVYARSKTALEGGFIGMERVVSEADLTKTKTELQTQLREELYAEAEAEVPQDFILFRTLSTFSFEDLPQTGGSGANTTVNQRGHLYGVMFKRSDLAKFLAQQKLSIPATDNVTIQSYDSLNILFASVPPADLLPLNEISFKVSGDAKLLWVTDEVALRADLAGRYKRDVPGILNNYPTIARASVTVRPFWKSSLPDEPEKIKITQLSAD